MHVVEKDKIKVEQPRELSGPFIVWRLAALQDFLRRLLGCGVGLGVFSWHGGAFLEQCG
jgi:hypothetical protein